jgi:hypothetical protein
MMDQQRLKMKARPCGQCFKDILLPFLRNTTFHIAIQIRGVIHSELLLQNTKHALGYTQQSLYVLTKPITES